MLNSSCKDEALLSRSFFNWKDTTQGFRHHEKSKCHLDAMHTIMELPRTTGDVGEMLSNSHKHEKAANQNVFLKIVDNIRYFACQGSHFAATTMQKASPASCKNDEILAALVKWLERKGDKYCSPEIQMRSWRSYP